MEVDMSMRDLTHQEPMDVPWRARAACLHADPELFFPKRGMSDAPGKAICRLCPVRIECLDDAITYDMRGIWGGLSKHERDKVSRWWWRDRERALALIPVYDAQARRETA